MDKNKKEQEKKKKWLGFQKKERIERIEMLENNDFLDKNTKKILLENENLPLEIANQITENNIATFSLPMGIAPNFLIDGKEYAVPMVTEEPSVIAAASYAAKIISKCKGFKTIALDRKMIGEIALYDIIDFEKAKNLILQNENKILEIANEAYPSIVKRGGGAICLEIKNFEEFLVVYLTVDVKEAMGANILNTMLEGIKPLLEELTNSTALMGILSNYATKSLVTATCEIDSKLLGGNHVAKKIDLASKFAKIDTYRAATHNKGIFNGIDAVVIATGNDWRGIEAAGHAFAAKNGKYEGLTTWTFDEKINKLKGELTLPMPVASVGGSIGLNPSVTAAFDILKNPSAIELAKIIVSVGLAQNLAAIKALVTTGIQKGHMKLQARTLALFSGAKDDEVDLVVNTILEKKLIINSENIKNILEEIRNI